MITEGNTTRGSVRFKLDGLTKTIDFPVSGAALHQLAGNPTTLVSGDVVVPNTDAPFMLVQDQNLISTHTLRGAKPLVASVEHSPMPGAAVIPPAVVYPASTVVEDKARVVADEAKLAADLKKVEADKA